MHDFQPADSLSLQLFTLFAAFMMVFILRAMRVAKVPAGWTTAFAVLVVLFAVVPSSGLLRLNFFPLGPLLFASILVFAVAFSFSVAGEKMAARFSLALLIGFQMFRLPLELILHHWADIGTVPPTMTWTGQNWDILSGITALVTARLVNGNRPLAIAVNALGFVLLLNVLRVVILSSPLPFAWPLEKPLLLIAYFPYAWIAPLFVLPALVGHLVTFRKLYKKDFAQRRY